MGIAAAIRKSVKWGGAALCLPLTAAWIGSGFYGPYFLSGDIWVMLDAGCIKLVWTKTPRKLSWWPPVGPVLWTTQHPAYSWTYYRGRININETMFVPLWFAIAPAALATLFAWRQDAMARRRRHGVECPKCGYDIRGLPPSSPCPECGTAAAGAMALAERTARGGR